VKFDSFTQNNLPIIKKKSSIKMGDEVWDFKRFMEFAKQVLADADSLQFRKEVLGSISE